MSRPLVVFADSTELARVLAREIADAIAITAAAGRQFVLGAPAGRTPVPTYQALVREVAARRLDLGHVTLALMDEYVVGNDHEGFRPVDPSLQHSCARFGREEIFEPVGRAAEGAGQQGPAQLLVPDPVDAAHYDEQLAALGGIDLFLLASGASDGHVAFNPPGSARESRTRVVELAPSTRTDNLGTFPGFRSVDDVPTHGVSVGIATIADLSRRAVMILDGRHKAEAFRRISAARGYEPTWPATVVREVEAHEVLVTRDAVDARATGSSPRTAGS